MNPFKISIIGIFLFSSCNNKAENKVIKTAKSIPFNYLNTADKNLFIDQDTIYFKQLKFSGFIYSLFQDADTEFVKSYYNGVDEGAQKKWYDNKQMAEQRFYINGEKDGVQQAWWPDGKQKFIYTAERDMMVGELKEWNSAGHLNKDFNYVNGQEEGSEKMWWDDGTIRANYVIRNGKRYGLLGIKICVNPYDSIVNREP